MVLDFPESVQRAWIGTAEYYTSTQAYLEKVVEHLKDLTLQDALGYYDKLSRMLRIFMTKLREKQGKKPATQKHLLRQARAHLNVIYLRCYGEMFNTKDVASLKQRAPNYKKRASRRKGAWNDAIPCMCKNCSKGDNNQYSSADGTTSAEVVEKADASVISTSPPKKRIIEGFAKR